MEEEEDLEKVLLAELAQLDDISADNTSWGITSASTAPVGQDTKQLNESNHPLDNDLVIIDNKTMTVPLSTLHVDKKYDTDGIEDQFTNDNDASSQSIDDIAQAFENLSGQRKNEYEQFTATLRSSNVSINDQKDEFDTLLDSMLSVSKRYHQTGIGNVPEAYMDVETGKIRPFSTHNHASLTQTAARITESWSQSSEPTVDVQMVCTTSSTEFVSTMNATDKQPIVSAYQDHMSSVGSTKEICHTTENSEKSPTHVNPTSISFSQGHVTQMNTASQGKHDIAGESSNIPGISDSSTISTPMPQNDPVSVTQITGSTQLTGDTSHTLLDELDATQLLTIDDLLQEVEREALQQLQNIQTKKTADKQYRTNETINSVPQSSELSAINDDTETWTSAHNSESNLGNMNASIIYEKAARGKLSTTTQIVQHGSTEELFEQERQKLLEARQKAQQERERKREIWLEKRKQRCAIKITAVLRGWRDRKLVRLLLQARRREQLLQMQLKRQREAAERLAREKQHSLELQRKREDNSIKIQTVVRMFLAKCILQRLRTEHRASCVQKIGIWMLYHIRRRQGKHTRAVIRIQRWLLQRILYRRVVHFIHSMSLQYKAHFHRRIVLWWRGIRCARWVRIASTEWHHYRISVRIIEHAMIQYQCRHRATRRIQYLWRCYLRRSLMHRICTIGRNSLIHKHRCAKQIQSIVRGWLLRRRVRHALLSAKYTDTEIDVLQDVDVDTFLGGDALTTLMDDSTPSTTWKQLRERSTTQGVSSVSEDKETNRQKSSVSEDKETNRQKSSVIPGTISKTTKMASYTHNSTIMASTPTDYNVSVSSVSSMANKMIPQRKESLQNDPRSAWESTTHSRPTTASGGSHESDKPRVRQKLEGMIAHGKFMYGDTVPNTSVTSNTTVDKWALPAHQMNDRRSSSSIEHDDYVINNDLELSSVYSRESVRINESAQQKNAKLGARIQNSTATSRTKSMSGRHGSTNLKHSARASAVPRSQAGKDRAARFGNRRKDIPPAWALSLQQKE